jgi:hypothetical protein
MMDYAQFFTLMVTSIGGFAFLYREMKQIEKDLKEDTKTQSARTDKLYEMFIDLLKEGRK